MFVLPQELILVRHGESEANRAQKHASEHGDESHFTEALRTRHTSTINLTAHGVRQMQQTGAWLTRHYARNPRFDGYFVSPFRRAKQSAAHLQLPRAQWVIQPALRERNWGDMDQMPSRERKERWPEHMQHKDSWPLHWQTIGGEAYVDVCDRLMPFLIYLGTHFSGGRVVCVGHGETLQALRVLIEHIPEKRYAQERAGGTDVRWENGDAVIYEQTPTGQRRAIYRNDADALSSWARVPHQRFSNEELLAWSS